MALMSKLPEAIHLMRTRNRVASLLNFFDEPRRKVAHRFNSLDVELRIPMMRAGEQTQGGDAPSA